MDSTDALQWAELIILLALSAFFSSAETAFTTLNPIRIKTLADEGSKRAQKILGVKQNSGKMLSTILIGNTLVNMFASSLATTITIRIWGNRLVGVVTGILTFLVLLFGEIMPKTLATMYAEKLSLAYVAVVSPLMKIMTPVVNVVDFIASGLFRLFHIKASPKAVLTESELRTIVDASHKEGVIETEERKMIHNVFDFGDSLAKDIMIPRIDMACVEADDSYGDLMEVYRKTKYTRVPVYEKDTNNVVGIINVKDLLLIEQDKPFHIRDIMRKAYYTYEYKHTSELLMLMKNQSINMAIILDEYGATTGLITLEDLLEEIVGEIRDEYDEEEELLVQKVAANEYIVEGSMKLDDINDALGLHLDSEDYDSIGGLIIELIDRIPEVGESVMTKDAITLIVDSKDKNRIDKVHMYIPALIQEPHVLYEGRPTDAADRQERELRCYDLLDELHIPYFRVDHEPLSTIADCDVVDGILDVKICKNLFLCNARKTNFYLLMMDGEKRFKTKDISAQLKISRLSFADSQYMEEFLDLSPGSVSVLGLMNDKDNRVKLLIDEDILKEEYLACHPCVNTSSLKFKTHYLTEKILPALHHEAVVITIT